VYRAALRSLLAHKLRLVLTSLSIALGVGFLAGTFVLTDTMNTAFDELFENVSTGTDVSVRSKAAFANTQAIDSRKPVPASLLETVRSVDGVAAAEGSVTGFALLTDPQGKPIQPGGAPTIGASWPKDPAFTGALEIRSGRGPERPGEVAVDARSAKQHGLRPGDRIRILFVGPAETFTVVGVAGFGGEDTLGGSTSAFFDTATAQRVLGKPGAFDTIDVRTEGGVQIKTLADRIGAALPAGAEAVPADEVAAESSQAIQEDLGFFRIALQVFAFIALFVGSFIIWNTFSILVTQRTRELALLRAIGATRRQVMQSVLLEAAMLGAAASAIGIGLGIVIAEGLQQLLSAFGLELPSTSTQIRPRTVVVSLVAGLAITLVAAVAPARRATHVAPVEALRDSVPGGYRFSMRRLVAGVIVTSAGLALVVAGLLAGQGLSYVGAGLLATFLGVTALSPLVVRPLARVVGAPFPRLAGMAGKLARENALRNPKRTASTAAALMVGLSLVISVSVFAASLKTSFHDVLANATKADLHVLPTSTISAGFSPAVADRLRRDDRVATVSEMSFGVAKFTGGRTQFSTVEPATVEQVLDLGLTSGSVSALGSDGVLVYTKKAEANGWRVGSRVPAEFAETGPATLRVAGIFDNKDWVGTDYVISLAAYDRHFTTRLDSGVMLRTKPGADVDAVQASLAEALADHPEVKVENAAQFEQTVGTFIDQLLGLITVLLLLAVIIALLGIVNTLALSVFERTRELGLLRAVGMTQRQVRRMVRWESVIVAILGAALGTVMGVGFGVALSRALEDVGVRSITVPTGQLALYVLLAGLAGVLAAIGPARSAARVDMLRAVVTE